MGRFRSGHGRTKNSWSGDNNDQSQCGEIGVEQSPQSVGIAQSPPKSSPLAMPKPSGDGKAGRESDMNRTPLAMSSLTHQRLRVQEATGGPERHFPIADMTSTDDPFEDFEVESGSEKEFLIANLKNDAPKDEVEQFRGACKLLPANYSSNEKQFGTNMNQGDSEETARTARVSDTYFVDLDGQEFKFLQSATPAKIDARVYELILCEQDENGQTPLPSLEYPAPHLVLQKKVEEFAQSHMFTVNKHIKPTTLQRREFTRDVYDYARAVGMGRHQANVEVMRARAAYRHDRGVPGGLKLDESDDESTLGFEINDSAEYIISMKHSMQSGPIDPAGAWAEITRLKAKVSHSRSPSMKRKRESLGSHVVNKGVIAAERTGGDENHRALKRHKRRKRRQRQDISDKERTKPEKREHPTFNKSDGSMGFKPEELQLGNTASKPVPTRLLSPKHVDESYGEIAQDKPNSTEDNKLLWRKNVEKPKVGKLSAHNHSGHNDAEGNTWDLRQKKKKKRKRKNTESSDKNSRSLDAETKAEPDDRNTNNSLFKDLANIRNVRKVGITFTENQNEGVLSDIANGHDPVKPLSELVSTDSDKKMQGRRDRGRRKKTIVAAPEESIPVEIEAPKDHHS